MPQYQYRVIPAPNRGVKAKGIKSPEDRFSHALEEVMNQMAAEGWAYQRAETLPSIERAGLTSTKTEWRNVLVFRKAMEEAVPEPASVVVPAAEHRADPPISAPASDSEADQTAESGAANGADTPQTGHETPPSKLNSEKSGA
ncbi:DUF4177 domain-containing protein [uncultured Roseobacter sp.]|uniref:DUF4177 domain-containing protein n=1 Tax=uncultured Roseobacter sp. TaxID=114847 RepID=UPI0026228BBD|nr:DUF4177 domain-containing protein [uncultured Roseobacter sp.]